MALEGRKQSLEEKPPPKDFDFELLDPAISDAITAGPVKSAGPFPLQVNHSELFLFPSD